MQFIGYGGPGRLCLTEVVLTSPGPGTNLWSGSRQNLSVYQSML